MVKILHLIDQLSSAGPTRSLIASAKYAAQQGIIQQHRIITLRKNVYPLTLIEAKKARITVLRKPNQETLIQEIQAADIVQVHFWNSPEIYEFLRLQLPKMRLSIWCHVIGDKPPQIITSQLVNYSDYTLVTSPYTLDLAVLAKFNSQKIHLIYDMADWDRLADIQLKPHNNFNVGYIGTVNFAKMNPNYIAMSASIDIPNVKFIVCGGGISKSLEIIVQEMGINHKFDFRGYVEKIKSVLEICDVFGYPLCEDTYATSEKSLQEAMYAGIPPVVFPYGGVKYLVENNQTGLVVNSDLEYKQAVEYLYHHPQERLRLGANARNYALEHFNSQYWARKLHEVYQKMMQLPKRRHNWSQLAEYRHNRPPAQLFIESLAESASQFQVSFTAVKMEKLLKAEAEIANSSVLLASGEGGIIQYRNYYPDDSFLRLWSGLVLQSQNRHSVALKEFQTALELDNNQVETVSINRPSTYWHIAKSAIKIKDFETAKTFLHQVIESVPDFMPAQEILNAINE